MAKLFFGLNQSLDGYVDYQEFAPGPSLFRHFYEQVRDLTGSVYGRRMYEVMRIWDEDRSEWSAEQRDFAAAWRSQPKWVVSRSLKSVGPNATLVEDDIEAVIRGLKAQLVGEIQVGGPDLAGPDALARSFGSARNRSEVGIVGLIYEGLRWGYPRASILSCVLVAKSLASCRSRNCSSGRPLARLTIRPRLPAGTNCSR